MVIFYIVKTNSMSQILMGSRLAYPFGLKDKSHKSYIRQEDHGGRLRHFEIADFNLWMTSSGVNILSREPFGPSFQQKKIIPKSVQKQNSSAFHMW